MVQLESQESWSTSVGAKNRQETETKRPLAVAFKIGWFFDRLGWCAPPIAMTGRRRSLFTQNPPTSGKAHNR